MRYVYAIILTCLLCGCLWHPAASQYSQLRQKRIAVTTAVQAIDTLSVVPGTLVIAPVVPGNTWQLDAVNALFTWLTLPPYDSVTLQYRVFASRLNASVYRYRYDSISNFFKAMPGVNSPNTATASQRLMDFGNLTYTGSFGRSLSFGNTQDAVVNSLFNLQINGMLGDSIELAAAITDNNIPIQPDGTTQQLNEFDRIWLQFKKRDWEVNLGDIDVRQQPSYFLSFFKRQQGMAVQLHHPVSKTVKGQTFASGAIAKGKFTRNIFNGLEGNQGPYRLQGANGELFFVVLAGTERVFIDGVQLQRGEDQDYVINYNTAEVTFTPRQLINKDKRIQIEFEYADRNYLNTLLFINQQWQVGNKLKLTLGAYNNADAKNSPINQTLSNEQRQFLAQLGDSIQNAFYAVATPDTFSAGKILYILADTLVGGTSYPIYKYSPQSAPQLYNLSFTEVGQGRGNYMPLFNAANGKVFHWVAPLNGVPQGQYEPVAFLVTPKKQQMFTAALQYNISPRLVADAEMGYSVWDVNTFSRLDKQNNGGLGLKASLAYRQPLQIRGKRHNLLSTARFERVHQNFRPLERLRTVEFLRDWGLPFNAPAATENLPQFALELAGNDNHSVKYDYTAYVRSDRYQGQRHAITQLWNHKGWMLSNVVKYTHFSGAAQQGSFLRPQIELQKTLQGKRPHQFGASYLLEHNEVRQTTADTLLPISFSFRDWKAFYKSNPAKPNRYTLSWMQRKNLWPAAAGFIPQDVNDNFNLLLELLASSKHQFRLNTSYRTLKVLTPGINNLQAENTLLGRAEYLMRVWKGGITGNILYEVGSGQEQQRDFSYIEVPAGRGEYAWIDYNADGIPQLNEFELAPFPDQAKYIRIFTPTNRFVRANYTTLNYSLQFTPRTALGKSTRPFHKFLSRFNAQASLQTNSKRLSQGQSLHFNPFQGNTADTSLISLLTNVANTLSYNRFSAIWGVDFTQVANTNKAILTYGFETRTLQDYTLRIRRNFGRQWITDLTLKTGNQALATPNPKFDNRNFSFNTLSVAPGISYIKGTTFRVQTQYRYDAKTGEAGGQPQQSLRHALSTDVRYNVLQKSVINTKLIYSHINFEGTPNSTVGFIMLEGLQPGNNIQWNIDFTRRLNNSLELSMQYEGRQAANTRTVHIGRASLRAIL